MARCVTLLNAIAEHDFILHAIGSGLHMMRTLAHPRWEDFNFEPLDDVHNRFHWLGDGRTYNEKTASGDRMSH